MLEVKYSSQAVEQWIKSLPLAEMLASLLPCDLEGVLKLSSEQMSAISRNFSTDVLTMLQDRCTVMKSSLSNTTANKRSFEKYKTSAACFPTISNHNTSVYDEIGHPNQQWETAMKKEHEAAIDLFKAGDAFETCAWDEWTYVVDGVAPPPPPPQSLNNARVLKTIEQYLSMDITSLAGLTRPEVIALVLYSGPMHVLWNIILRKYPVERFTALRKKDSLFPTSIFVLISAIQKISRTTAPRGNLTVYRGINAQEELPPAFTGDLDCRGGIGLVEMGFMSTSTEIALAASPSPGGVAGTTKGKIARSRVLMIHVSCLDCVADIQPFSQYPSEHEYVWAPHTFLEPVGGNRILVSEQGVVEVIPVRALSKVKALTLEEYEMKAREAHLNAFKTLLGDLQQQLNKVLTAFCSLARLVPVCLVSHSPIIHNTPTQMQK